MIWLFSSFVIFIIYIFYWFISRKQRNRKKILKAEFPKQWEAILNEKVAFYVGLQEEEKIRFKQLIHIFINEKRIVGIKTEINDEIKLLVAASAIIPVFGLKNWEYDNLGEIFVTDGSVKDYEIDKEHSNSILGQVQPMFGHTYYMTLSKQSLLHGFNAGDEENVGIHEFAHILDEADGVIDGIPSSYLSPELIPQWISIADEEMSEIKKGKSTINEYGATNRAEFFAVSTEYFFDKPKDLLNENPTLYNLLKKTYHQDPVKFFNFDLNTIFYPYGKKTDRNAPCPCESGLKFKKCCLKKDNQSHSE